MPRYVAYKFTVNGAIVIDTLEQKWAFYHTNIHNQIYNIDTPFEKISKQRINGLMKRLNKSFYDSLNGYVVDRYIYHFIFTEEQRNSCRNSVYLNEKEFIASGENLRDVLLEVGKYFLKEDDPDYQQTMEYYEEKLKEITAA